MPRYVAELEDRFTRRYDLAAMRPRLTRAALRTPPMPYRLLKLADVYASARKDSAPKELAEQKV